MGDVARNGLFSRLLDDQGSIVEQPWVEHVQGRMPVGVCRVCDGSLMGAMPTRDGALVWFGARCVSCSHEVWAPNGRTARGSSARSRMRARV